MIDGSAMTDLLFGAFGQHRDAIIFASCMRGRSATCNSLHAGLGVQGCTLLLVESDLVRSSSPGPGLGPAQVHVI